MINTNGLRIAREPEFVTRLAENKRGFEVYLQFDSLEREALINLRGADLRKIRQQALENLEHHGISTTLVATIKRGVNDHEIGDIVRHALTWKCVRGVTLQPVQDAGRNENFNKNTDRIMLSEIRKRVVEAAARGDNDMIPLPCNPESISIGYGCATATRAAGPADSASAVADICPTPSAWKNTRCCVKNSSICFRCPRVRSIPASA